MEEMKMREKEDVIQATAAVLHLGNIGFREQGVERAVPDDPDQLEWPAHLLAVDQARLESKLTSRVMSIAGETVDKTLNVEQAVSTRDALAKAIYYRLFEFLVKVNSQRDICLKALS